MLNSIIPLKYYHFFLLCITPHPPQCARAHTHAHVDTHWRLSFILVHSAFYPFKHCDPICQVECAVGVGEVAV